MFKNSKRKKKPNKFFLFFYRCKKTVIAHFDLAILFILLGLFAFASFSITNWRWNIEKIAAGMETTENFKGQLVKGSSAIAIEKAPEPKENIVNQWDIYENKWYGFKINYPSNWSKPVDKKPPINTKWEYRYQFRKNPADSSSDLFSGFDVIIYNVAKADGYFETDEFPTHRKDIENSSIGDCLRINGHLFSSNDFTAEEVYIPTDDSCFYPGFFLTLTKDNYVYNIIPVPQRSLSEKTDIKKEALTEFPEFFEAARTFELITIVRPKPVPPKPKAPKPVSYKIENGRLACAKKNDKPGKSDQHKGKHLDMECCLDPDEYPNPWCYYPPSKYGKYL